MTEHVGTEFWRWREYAWAAPGVSPPIECLLTAGVDVGSVSSQAVILANGELVACSSLRTGPDSPASAQSALERALGALGMGSDRLRYVVGTGYGRVNMPFADRTVTEIACHARGASYMYGPSVRTVLDMGGQDCKAIRCDEKGKVTAFLMNDKCAAGTGRGMEVFAELLAVPIGELGELSLTVDREPPPVSSTCVVFAKSEASALLRQGWPRNLVTAAYCAAMAQRVASLLRRLGVERELAITGGIAKNAGIVRRLERELGLTALTTSYDTQLAGALGAALIAADLAARGSGRDAGAAIVR